MNKLCDCAVCGEPVPVRPYQAPTARTCSPNCAKVLALREDPDLQPNTKSTHWKQRLAEEIEHEDQEDRR